MIYTFTAAAAYAEAAAAYAEAAAAYATAAAAYADMVKIRLRTALTLFSLAKVHIDESQQTLVLVNIVKKSIFSGNTCTPNKRSKGVQCDQRKSERK